MEWSHIFKWGMFKVQELAFICYIYLMAKLCFQLDTLQNSWPSNYMQICRFSKSDTKTINLAGLISGSLWGPCCACTLPIFTTSLLARRVFFCVPSKLVEKRVHTFQCQEEGFLASKVTLVCCLLKNIAHTKYHKVNSKSELYSAINKVQHAIN